jgi:hypothetical protein
MHFHSGNSLFDSETCRFFNSLVYHELNWLTTDSVKLVCFYVFRLLMVFHQQLRYLGFPHIQVTTPPPCNLYEKFSEQLLACLDHGSEQDFSNLLKIYQIHEPLESANMSYIQHGFQLLRKFNEVCYHAAFPRFSLFVWVFLLPDLLFFLFSSCPLCSV